MKDRLEGSGGDGWQRFRVFLRDAKSKKGEVMNIILKIL
jgi:hypothetical protein